MSEWILASKCPHCGGRMILNEFYSFSRNYLIRRDGRLRKRCRKSSEGGMDACIVVCEKCGTVWESSDTFCCDEKVFVRVEGVEK